METLLINFRHRERSRAYYWIKWQNSALKLNHCHISDSSLGMCFWLYLRALGWAEGFMVVCLKELVTRQGSRQPPNVHTEPFLHTSPKLPLNGCLYILHQVSYFCFQWFFFFFLLSGVGKKLKRNAKPKQTHRGLETSGRGTGRSARGTLSGQVIRDTFFGKVIQRPVAREGWAGHEPGKAGR